MVVNGRPLKRMKRRVTADLSDFLTFPAGLEPPRGPFRSNVKAFLTEHALFPPPSTLFPHLMTWQISFRVGDLAESLDSSPAVVSLDVVEEDVAKSRSVYCDQCRVVGWSGHPVCCKRYHFIIKADANSIAGFHKPCTCCGDLLHISELSVAFFRCKTCNHVTSMEDVEEWVYQQLEDTSHLLHGVVHGNGYGHLLRVNGREGGSRILSGCHIMDFWDRLCTTLAVREVSVMDVSKKYGLEYRLLHAITKGHPWYGNWGYKFVTGSFALTLDTYNSALQTLSTIPLSLFLSQSRKPRTQLQGIIVFYQSLSDHELVNTRDLFCFLIGLIHAARKSPSSKVGDCNSCKAILLDKGDVERVEDAMVRVLRAVSGSTWVSCRALRGAVCKVAGPELLEYCLKGLGGKVAADGLTVSTRWNPDSRSFEYRLELGNPPSKSASPHPLSNLPSKETLTQDLKFLYEHLLHPKTMLPHGPDPIKALAIKSSEKLLDCKQFLKSYPTQNPPPSNSISLSCNLEIIDQTELPPKNPAETVVLPPNSTVSDLKLEASKAFQEVYIVYKRFQAEEILGYEDSDSDSDSALVGSTESVVIVRGRCKDKGSSLGKFRMERGVDRWTVDCRCGARDDDGERMLACDVCGVWLHTRCSGIRDFESVPAKFVCYRCGVSGRVGILGV